MKILGILLKIDLITKHRRESERKEKNNKRWAGQSNL